MKTYLVRHNDSHSLIEINPCIYGRLLKCTDMIVEEIRNKLAQTYFTIPELFKIDWIDEVEELENDYITYKRIFTNNL